MTVPRGGQFAQILRKEVTAPDEGGYVARAGGSGNRLPPWVPQIVDPASEPDH